MGERLPMAYYSKLGRSAALFSLVQPAAPEIMAARDGFGGPFQHSDPAILGPPTTWSLGVQLAPARSQPGQEADSGVMVSERHWEEHAQHTPPSVKYNTARQWDTAGPHRSSARCWDGLAAWKRGGREAQEGGQIGILIAGSRCKAIIPQLKSKKKEVKGKTSRGRRMQHCWKFQMSPSMGWTNALCSSGGRRERLLPPPP